uniref:Fgf8/17/18 n=1 Tax=Terebratalia transversa TaxID=34513 RepID=A0A0U2LZH4_TERTR|nr:fgf8/17/18 [Terebratalia transversa]
MGWDLMRCQPFKVLLAIFVVYLQLSINTVYCSSIFDKLDFKKHVDKDSRPSFKQASYRKKLQLQCQCVTAGDGLVQFIPSKNRSRQLSARGRREDLKFISLVAVSDSFGSKLRLQSEKYKTFLCFSKKGKLILRQHGDKKRCVFKEKITKDNYIELQSAANPKWYVGFNSHGKPLRGYARRSNKRRKCFQFSKLEVKDVPKTKPTYGPPKMDLILERFRFQLKGSWGT